MNTNENSDILVQTVYSNYIRHVNNNNRLLSDTIDVIRNQNNIYNYIIRHYITTSHNNSNNRTTPAAPIEPAAPIMPNHSTVSINPIDITSDMFLSTIYNNIINSSYDIENNIFINRNQNNVTLPTINDLLEATTYSTYGEIDNPINETCPISHKDFSNNDIVLTLITCKHIFEPTSIMKWFTRCSECPLCRRSIINNTININNEESNDQEESDDQAESDDQDESNDQDEMNNQNEMNNQSQINNNTYSFITRHLAYIITRDISNN